MLQAHIALVPLVSEPEALPVSELTRVAAALNKQAARDFNPIWDVLATVDAFARLEDVPAGYWPIVVRDDIGDPGAGYHVDEDGQPFALVRRTNVWSLAASHECLEMLADPSGTRTVSGPSVRSGEGRVDYLLEVCDPCQAPKFAYAVDGVMVSDFCTPSFFEDPTRATGVRYSFTGALEGPREVLEDGYLSWRNPTTNRWEQLHCRNGEKEYVDCGELEPLASPRETIDAMTPHPALESGVDPGSEHLRSVEEARKEVERSAERRAGSWRTQVEAFRNGASS